MYTSDSLPVRDVCQCILQLMLATSHSLHLSGVKCDHKHVSCFCICVWWSWLLQLHILYIPEHRVVFTRRSCIRDKHTYTHQPWSGVMYVFTQTMLIIINFIFDYFLRCFLRRSLNHAYLSKFSILIISF